MLVVNATIEVEEIKKINYLAKICLIIYVFFRLSVETTDQSRRYLST